MGNRNNYSIVLLFLTVLAWTTPVTARDMRVDVSVMQSAESVAAEQTNSMVTVDPSHVPAGGKATILVEVRGEGGMVMAARTVKIRLLTGATLVGSAQKITDENGLVVFTVASPTPQTARVEAYDVSNTPPTKLIQEPTIIFDGGGSSESAWYTQVITFLVNFFRLRF